MPSIMPIRNLRNTSEISEIAHKEQQPIFITKNGSSDLVVMSSELYDKFANMNRIDQAIYESEKEMEEGGEAIDLDEIFDYITNELQTPENVWRQTDRLWDALRKLDTFPQSHQERTVGKYAG